MHSVILLHFFYFTRSFQGSNPSMLVHGANHKFFYADLEIESVIKHDATLRKLDPNALFPESTKNRAAEIQTWKVNLVVLENKLEQLRTLHRLLNTLARSVEFLSSSSLPRIGHVLQQLRGLREAIKALRAEADEGGADAVGFLKEAQRLYDSEFKNLEKHPLMELTQGLTPSVLIELGADDGVKAVESMIKIARTIKIDLPAAAAGGAAAEDAVPAPPPAKKTWAQAFGAGASAVAGDNLKDEASRYMSLLVQHEQSQIKVCERAFSSASNLLLFCQYILCSQLFPLSFVS